MCQPDRSRVARIHSLLKSPGIRVALWNNCHYDIVRQFHLPGESVPARTESGNDSSPQIETISVIVPDNPFIRGPLTDVKHCLAALDVAKLMDWWPGRPHVPHRNPKKVRAIQRSLDWKRVTQIAAYLLQQEIVDTPNKLDLYFSDIYQMNANEPGREWPPQVPSVAKFQRSAY